jgi:hypothetical protein
MAEISTNSQTQSEIIINQIFHDNKTQDPVRVPTDFVDDELIEAIWQELDGRVPHDQIRQTVYQVATRYVDARVMNFITIFIRRMTLEQLMQ